MSIRMTATNDYALNQFLTSHTSNMRLIIRKNELHLVDKSEIGFWTCLKAQFGHGNAAMRQVAAYVHANRNNLFPQEDKNRSIQNKQAFNQFISRYNYSRRSLFKLAKHVGKIEAETITLFGKEEWERIGIKVPDAPPIPDCVKKSYHSRCRIWPDKTIGETHMLVLIPKWLGNKLTTVNRLQRLADNYFTDEYMHHIYQRILKEEDGHYNISNSYWVLMTKEVIPGSLGKQITEINIPDGYEAPSIIEANVCLLTQYFRNKKIDDKTSYIFHETLTWCDHRNAYGHYPVAGGSDEKGISLYYSALKADAHIGLAVVKRF